MGDTWRSKDSVAAPAGTAMDSLTISSSGFTTAEGDSPLPSPPLPPGTTTTAASGVSDNKSPPPSAPATGNRKKGGEASPSVLQTLGHA